MIKHAIWAVRSSKKNSGYPKECIEFESSIDKNEAMNEWRQSHLDETIWAFEFVRYV